MGRDARCALVALAIVWVNGCSDETKPPAADARVDVAAYDAHVGDHTSPTPDKGTPSPDNGVPTPDKGAPSPDNGVPTPDKGAPSPDNGVPSPDKGTPSPDNGLPATDAPVPGSIGPAGGTASSPDGLASIQVPAGALSSTRVFSLSQSAAAPAGNLDKAYDIGPSGTTFATPATVRISYDPSKLGGTAPSSLQLATVVSGAWQAIAGSTVDTVKQQVSGPVSHLSTFGIVGGAGQAVSKVEIAAVRFGSAKEMFVCEKTGVNHIRGVPIDGNNEVVAGAVISYSSANPSVLAVDATGKLTGGTLSVATTVEKVTITMSSGGASATQDVAVLPCPTTTVGFGKWTTNLFPGTPGPGSVMSVVENPGQTWTSDAQAIIDSVTVPAGSLFTVKVHPISAGYLDAYYTLASLSADTHSSNGSELTMMLSMLIPTSACGSNVDLSKPIILSSSSSTAGAKVFVDSPNAKVVYMDKSMTPQCSATSAAAQGMTLIHNIDPGLHYYFKKTNVPASPTLAMFLNLPAGNSAIMVP